MTEKKPNEKLKSTLSADVPPFVPRSCNMALLSNAIPAQNRISHIPQYTEESEWYVPVIPHVSSGVVFPMAPVLHAEYQLQSSQENGYYVQNCKFLSTKKQFPSKAKKNIPWKNLEEKTISAANATIVTGDLLPQSSHASSEDEGRQRETSRYQNPKLKINFVRSNDKHIKIMTSHKSSASSVKLESSTEFPSLPAPSNENRLFSETYNNEPYECTQHSSYSSILQSPPKHPSDLSQKQDISFSNKEISVTNKAKRTSQQNIHRKLKAERIQGKRHSFHEDKNKFDDTRESEQNDIFKSDAECSPPHERKPSSSSKHSCTNASESVIERKKHMENNMKNNQIIDASSREENSITHQVHLRQSSSKDPEYVTERQKYLESRKFGGMTVNSSKKKNCVTDKMPSRHYGSKSVESVTEKKKCVESNKKNNEVITDASKEENSMLDEVYLKEHSWKAESMMERNKSSENYGNDKHVIIAGMDEEANMIGQSVKVQKSQKRRKRNKKKKKDNLGKVAILTPEVFANITNKMNKELKINQNGSFNLCDQVDFPSLSPFPSLTSDEVRIESQNVDNVKKSEISINSTSSGEKSLNMIVPNVWRPYSDVVQSNKAQNNEVQTNVTSMKKTHCDSKNEGTLVKTSKKKDRKKKKDNAASDHSKKTQVDNGKQIKSSSLIQISLTSMVTSLQQVKLNQMKKKETKARVISTKRGIMDKIANPHNILDASSPMRKRGKEKERPGKKRISAMRKIILREREKRRMRFLEAQKCKNEDECHADKQGDINANVTALSDNSVDNCKSSSKENCEQVDKKLQASKIILHTRKFRDYCDHMISEEIDSTVLALLKDLIRFQDRLHEKDPIKARMKRRLVYGLREVTKHLRLCKLKCIIIAPNIENIPSEGGLSDALQAIIKLAQQQDVPYLFALQRRSLGKVCMKIVPVSCVGIFNYDGAEGHYHKLLEFLTEARERYNEILKIISTFITEDIETQLLHRHILPAAVQPIRSKILSQIAMYNAFEKMTVSEDSKVKNGMGESITDESIGDALQRTEEISFVTSQFIQDGEPL